jgi:hypothetical protein
MARAQPVDVSVTLVSLHHWLCSPRLPARAKDSSTAMIGSNFELESIGARLEHVKKQGRTSDIEAAEVG